jgi:hypothetical protein
MSDIWYYGDGEKSVGPLSLADLAKTLSCAANAKDVLVWRDGFEQWQRAETVPELVALMFKPPQPPPLPPPLPSNLPSEPLLVPAAVNKDEDRPRYQETRIEVGRRRKNIIVAVVLSAVMLIGWNYFYGVPKVDWARQTQAQLQTARPAAPEPPKSREEALAASPRINLETAKLKGSIALKGGRIDDVSLKTYHETIDPKSPNITLFSPPGGSAPYFSETGYESKDQSLALPGPNSLWTVDSETLTPTTPVTLTFDNEHGLVFKRTISVDDQYMFTVKDCVENKGANAATLSPYTLIARYG